jgi:protein-tyrosine phosphatase
MASEIIPHLWLGNILDARNSEFMNKIDIVINCSKNIPFYSKTTRNIRIAVNDDLAKIEIANMYKYLDNATQFIYDNILKNKVIFVHCYAGKQRSATVICAYLMRYLHISYKEATELMRTKRYVVFTPLSNFDNALKLFETKINKTL